MATQTQPGSTSIPTIDSTVERVRELNEQVLDLGRKASVSFVEAQEATFKTVAEYQDKVADQSKVDWVASLARAQADFTREMTALYASTARELLTK
jgi:hypothetical protein